MKILANSLEDRDVLGLASNSQHSSDTTCHTPILKSIEPKPLHVCLGCLITRIATI
jgi:hypothetical protein